MVFEVDPEPNPREPEYLEIMRKGGASKGDGRKTKKVAPQKPREEFVGEVGVNVRGCWDTRKVKMESQTRELAVSSGTSFGQ